MSKFGIREQSCLFIRAACVDVLDLVRVYWTKVLLIRMKSKPFVRRFNRFLSHFISMSRGDVLFVPPIRLMSALREASDTAVVAQSGRGKLLKRNAEAFNQSSRPTRRWS